LGLLKEILPKLSRVAVLGTSTNASNAAQMRETRLAASTLGVQIQFLDVLRPDDIETAFRAAVEWRADAFLVLFGPILRPHRRRIAELALRSRLPAIYPFSVSVETGGLMSYGTSLLDLEYRTAIYVDKILKGAKPADLPIEAPTKFELIINLRTAKVLGITFPPIMLLRADKVIE
jgi:putative ABC transport system substrate-binding protein